MDGVHGCQLEAYAGQEPGEAFMMHHYHSMDCSLRSGSSSDLSLYLPGHTRHTVSGQYAS